MEFPRRAALSVAPFYSMLLYSFCGIFETRSVSRQRTNFSTKASKDEPSRKKAKKRREAVEDFRRNDGHPAMIKFSLRRCSTKYRRGNWRTSLPKQAISTILSACNHRSRSLLFSKDTMCTLYVYNDNRPKLGLLRTIGISFHSTDGKSIRPGNYDPRRR